MEFESVEDAQVFALIFGIALILWGLSAIFTKSITLNIGMMNMVGYHTESDASETKKGKDAVHWGIFFIFIGAFTIYMAYWGFVV